MTTRTIARNATRKIAAIREAFTAATRFDGGNAETLPCDAAQAWADLYSHRSARLIANDAGDFYTIRVTGERSYTLRKPVAQDVADRRTADSAEADRLARLRMSVFGDTSSAAYHLVCAVQDNCDETTADGGREFRDVERWRMVGDEAQCSTNDETTPEELAAAWAAVHALSVRDLDDFDHFQAGAGELLDRFAARLAAAEAA
ncbi:hypothetical protein ACFWNL_18475 [Kitasatospora sp. NPDC058397]|uniref:hypothetical protein n=1 Tax=unclassified Kitasatospora TaxID=2633591 RepID=UPI00365D422C